MDSEGRKGKGLVLKISYITPKLGLGGGGKRGGRLFVILNFQKRGGEKEKKKITVKRKKESYFVTFPSLRRGGGGGGVSIEGDLYYLSYCGKGGEKIWGEMQIISPM